MVAIETKELIKTLLGMIPWVIALISLIYTSNKDNKKIDEQHIRDMTKVFMKLDQLCADTNSIRVELRTNADRIGTIEKDFVALQRDLKTAFTRIDELREEVHECERKEMIIHEEH